MSKESPVIVMTGAGSGGHITPILAVAEVLKQKNPNCKLVYIGQKGDSLGDIPSEHPCIDEVYTVRAGKFRRYHGEGIKQIFDVPTMAKNFRDMFYVIAGFFQSRLLLKKLKPDVLFVKGGFVGVPVGLAAATRKIPYVTHDSDAIPGLANRIIAKWASLHAVAMPKEMYQYPAEITEMTGIPLQSDFRQVDDNLIKKYKTEVGVSESAKVLFVIGGGLGSQRINSAVIDVVPGLLEQFSDLVVLHAVGRAHEAEVNGVYDQRLDQQQRSKVRVYGYLNDVYKYSGAADLIITRAGATNLAEFSVQAKACVVIPSPFLAGGHQLKNAESLEGRGAISVLPENDLVANPNLLKEQVSSLLSDDAKRTTLANNFRGMAIDNGAERIADLLIKQIEGGHGAGA